MQRNLENKTVWVTGASGGMGQKIATTFSDMKMKVILSDINEDGLLKTASKCSNFVSIKPFDITSVNEVKKTIQEIKNEFGYLDILVNAAAVPRNDNGTICRSPPDDDDANSAHQ